MLALVLIATTDHTLGGLGLAVFGLFSFLLLILSEECIPDERGRFVVFAEIASVPAVLAISASGPRFSPYAPPAPTPRRRIGRSMVACVHVRRCRSRRIRLGRGQRPRCKRDGSRRPSDQAVVRSSSQPVVLLVLTLPIAIVLASQSGWKTVAQSSIGAAESGNAVGSSTC